MGIVGYVMNTAQGTVSGVIQGDAETMEEMKVRDQRVAALMGNLASRWEVISALARVVTAGREAPMQRCRAASPRPLHGSEVAPDGGQPILAHRPLRVP